ncbi:G protein-coupled receptor 103 [Mytilus galloprovincialis]|uniref:G protein-coupled receptor 103 n=1 Tax=Mytilus galloprovincialis TaxID=29158 RepID=A0A8B6GGN3_MYTGA|nr:G protein-coupled receptor 103 [Mytilus galloprovincialis]VDI63859.1 G protein-coupled receptor 103 [Mytilus galloprovincialis]
MSGDEHLGDIPGLTLSLSLMCIFAVCLNILLVTGILFTKKQQYSSVELFIVNLSISDILLAGVAVPVRINNASHKGESFVGGDAVCKLVMFLPLLTVSSSIYTMVAIAVDRYKEILKLEKLTTVRTSNIVLGTWIWSLVISSPQLYEYSTYRKEEDEYNITSCGAHGIVENFETLYACVAIVLSYAVPLIIITICYSKIMRYVWKVGKTSSENDIQVLKRMKVVKILLLITIVFILLWSPFFVLFGMEEILGLDDTLHTASWTQVAKKVLAVMSTMSNPIIYFASNSIFRRQILKFLTCGKVQLSRVNPEAVDETS